MPNRKTNGFSGVNFINQPVFLWDLMFKSSLCEIFFSQKLSLPTWLEFDECFKKLILTGDMNFVLLCFWLYYRSCFFLSPFFLFWRDGVLWKEAWWSHTMSHFVLSLMSSQSEVCIFFPCVCVSISVCVCVRQIIWQCFLCGEFVCFLLRACSDSFL